MRRLLIVPTAAAVLLTAVVPAATAATSGQVVHRESVLTELDAAGSPGTSRVFTQLTVPTGQEVRLPGQSTDSLRSLTGSASRDGDAVVFGGGLTRTVADHTSDLPVEVEVSYSIDGETVDPTDVAGHDGEVAVTYTVRNLTAEPTEVTFSDGDRVASRETVDVAVPLVGSLSMTLPSGFSDVVAPGGVVVGDGRGNTVVNWSLLLFAPLGAETQEVTWTATARDAAIPAASLQVIPVSPDSFGSFASTESAYQGAVASTRELTTGARTIDRNLGLLAEGAAKLLAGLSQLRDGSAELADGLVTARDGANELSDGLGSARTGAGTLSSGLDELSDGADQLAEGAATARTGGAALADGNGDLADGAAELAAGLSALDAGSRSLVGGLGQLRAGSSDLADGTGDLAAGATQLDSSAGELATGASDLATGAGRLRAGVEELSSKLQGADGLPSALGGIDSLQDGIGAAGTADTILDGLARLGAGLAEAKGGIGTPTAPDTLRNGVARVGGGLDNPACNPADPANAANPCGVVQLNSSVAALSAAILSDLQTAIGALTLIDESTLVGDDPDRLSTTIATLQTNATRAGTIKATADGIATVVAQLKGGLSLVDDGLIDLSAGIGDPTAGDTLRNGVSRITAGVSNPACDRSAPTDPGNPCGLLEGLEVLEAGLSAAAADVAAGLGSATTPDTLLFGAAQVAGGSAQLSDGAARLRTEGTSPLAAGADRAAAGAQQLAEGATAADAGGAQVGAGASQLATGSTALVDGATRAASGAAELSDGLDRLGDGSGDLADGARRAASGGDDLLDGLGQLEDGGRQLADGLVDAADGGQQLADGLAQAEPGGQQLVDGSQRLLAEGTEVLTSSVSEASADSSLQLAHVKAVAARGTSGDGLPYPTVDGADASAVYQFDLAGVGTTTGPGVAGRLGLGTAALLAAAVLGAAAGGRLGRRRDGALVDGGGQVDA